MAPISVLQMCFLRVYVFLELHYETWSNKLLYEIMFLIAWEAIWENKISVSTKSEIHKRKNNTQKFKYTVKIMFWSLL